MGGTAVDEAWVEGPSEDDDEASCLWTSLAADSVNAATSNAAMSPSLSWGGGGGDIGGDGV